MSDRPDYLIELATSLDRAQTAAFELSLDRTLSPTDHSQVATMHGTLARLQLNAIRLLSIRRDLEPAAAPKPTAQVLTFPCDGAQARVQRWQPPSFNSPDDAA